MAFSDRGHDLLFSFVLRQSLFDFRQRRLGPLQIGFVHHDNVGDIEHDNLLQLQARPIIGIHYQYSLIHQFVAKRQRLLPGSDGFDDDVVESGMRQQRETAFGRGRKSAGLTPRGHAAHKHPIVLRVDHDGAIAE